VGAAGDLEPDPVAGAELVGVRPQVDAYLLGWGLADVSRISPSVTFTDRPFGSTSHSRAKKSVCGRLELANSSAVTGPVIIRGDRSGSLV
jgi:hypothetical protein